MMKIVYIVGEQVWKYHHPRFFLLFSSDDDVQLPDGPLGHMKSDDIFFELHGGHDVLLHYYILRYNMPGLSSIADKHKICCNKNGIQPDAITN